jgi:hypothetical protein
MNKKPSTIKLFLVLACGLFALPIAYAQYSIRGELKQYQYNEVALTKITQAYVQLSTIDAFFPIASSKDAGVVLNPYIQLDDGAHPAEKNVWWNTLSKEQINAIKSKWSSSPEELPTQDDSILTSLLEYDHWDPNSSGSYATYLSTKSNTYLLNQPIPNLVNLQYLAKSRLARGLRESDILPALKEVRHLARLSQGHESIIDSMIGVALLSIERKAYEEAVHKGILGKDEWSAISEADCKLARKLVFAGVGVYLSQDEGLAVRRLQQLSVREFAQCATMHEAGMAQLLKNSVPSRWFGEANLFRPSIHFEKAWKESSCSLRILQPHWNQMNPLAELPSEEEYLFSIPYIRTWSLLSLMHLSPFVPDIEETNPLSR